MQRKGNLPELFPCPFCGGSWLEPKKNEDGISEGIVYTRITCASCGAEGPDGMGLPAAIEAWNRRGIDGEDKEEKRYGDTKIVKKD